MNMDKLELTIGGKTKRSNNGQHTVTVDWVNLPEASRDFIVRYGLKQYLADGAAGAANHDELVAGVNARVLKLANADFTRTRGEGSAKPDTETTIALRLAKEQIRATAKARQLTLPKEKVEEAAKALLAKQGDDGEILKEARRQMKAKEKLATADDSADAFLAELGLTD